MITLRGRRLGIGTSIATILLIIGTFVFFNDLSAMLHRQRDELEYLPETHAPSGSTTGGTPHGSGYNQNKNFTTLPIELDPWDPSAYITGPVTDNFRTSLRADKHYLTTWTFGGYTNEFMCYVNMIYLGMISDRIPIVPPFYPNKHISQDDSAPMLPFGTVYDVPGFRKTLRRPLLEWSDIQEPPSPRMPLMSRQPLGCWSAWVTANAKENKPRDTYMILNYLNLDVSYTAVPKFTRRLQDPKDDWDIHLQFWPLAEVMYPGAPSVISSELAQFPSPLGSQLLPDDRLACFDDLYYVSAGRWDFEWNHPWSPAWNAVGRYLRFARPLTELVNAYVRRALQVTEIPPIITIHVRRGDFTWGCQAPLEECVAPISVYARRVKEVQQELLEKQGINIPDHHVLLTSDEKDPAFWVEVAQQGWKSINHTTENTVQLHNEWYPPLIDIVAQSLGKGFVGTDGSTVSMVSRYRVEAWNEGVTRTVLWGRLGADDH